MQNAKSPILPNDIDKYVTHHYADNNGVRIHYVTIGEGQTSIVMIHGFPRFLVYLAQPDGRAGNAVPGRGARSAWLQSER